MIEFGRIIHERRLAVGMPQEVLAEKAYTCPKYVSAIEAGRRKGSIDMIECLLNVLGMKIVVVEAGEDGDLISRSAAIDALGDEPEVWEDPYSMSDEYTVGQRNQWRYDKSAIEALPSAQPEIIRCKDCKWFGDIGCAISIVDDSDKPTENDFCSYAER